MIKLLTTVVFGLLASLTTAAAPAACKLVKIGDVEVAKRDVPVAPVSINGHSAQLIVDTRNACARAGAVGAHIVKA